MSPYVHPSSLPKKAHASRGLGVSMLIQQNSPARRVSDFVDRFSVAAVMTVLREVCQLLTKLGSRHAPRAVGTHAGRHSCEARQQRLEPGEALVQAILHAGLERRIAGLFRRVENGER